MGVDCKVHFCAPPNCRQYCERFNLEMELKGKKVLVIGLGKTGIASARFLAHKGAIVFVTDEKMSALPSELSGLGIEFSPYDVSARGFDLIVPSPGVPQFNQILTQATATGIEVVSELELASRFLKVPIIAITGTNGKTTTTSLIAEMLIAGGKKVFVGGNIGNPVIDYVLGAQDDDFVVLEVSSFQLLHTATFHPQIALVLNITRDHTDYHGSFREYAIAKGKIFANQTSDDVAIINAEDATTVNGASQIQAKKLYFSSCREVDDGMYFAEQKLNCVVGRIKGAEYGIEKIRLPGLHNVENIMAAFLTAEFSGVKPTAIIQALGKFRGIAHRIEFVAENKGVSFYDDSKGTNVDAALRAIESFAGPLVLLLGGKDKDGDFSTLAEAIKNKVRKLILFGDARCVIGDAIGNIVDTVSVATMKEATKLAYSDACSGDVVLLSPACASFDEFNSYKHRGEVFQQIVKEMIGNG